jgi:hypothetical protein
MLKQGIFCCLKKSYSRAADRAGEGSPTGKFHGILSPGIERGVVPDMTPYKTSSQHFQRS